MYKYKNESIYFAGPSCFYTNGYDMWHSQEKRAKFLGFGVTMPHYKELNWDTEVPRNNADAIFKNCADAINDSTAIIVDLEVFRGSEPDGGSIFELGMAYARNCHCYGFTRDKREMVYKHQNVVIKKNKPYDAEGRELAYANIPFSPCVLGSSTIIEGDYEDALQHFCIDLDRERMTGQKNRIKIKKVKVKRERPLVYLATQHRFDSSAAKKYEKMKIICSKYGFEAVSPLDFYDEIPAPKTDDAYANAFYLFQNYVNHVQNCDVLIADLNDFHGREPNSDISFESGMAWQLGKKCYGMMDDIRPMAQKFEHKKTETGPLKDIYDFDVENFDYPINLMFSSSMPIFEGTFEKVMAKVKEDYSK